MTEQIEIVIIGAGRQERRPCHAVSDKRTSR